MSISKWWGYNIPDGTKPTARRGSFDLFHLYRLEQIKLRPDGPWSFNVYHQLQPGVPIELDAASFMRLETVDYPAYLKQLNDDPTDQLRATVLDQQGVINQLTVENESLREKLTNLTKETE